MIRTSYACALLLLAALSIPVGCQYEPPESNGTGGSGGTGSGGRRDDFGRGTVHCGAAECNEDAICCSNQSFESNPLAIECSLPAMCTDLNIQCDGPEDCVPGEQCCGIWNGNDYDGVMCTEKCEFPNYIICKLDDATPICPEGQECFEESIRLGPGYGSCDN